MFHKEKNAGGAAGISLLGETLRLQRENIDTSTDLADALFYGLSTSFSAVAGAVAVGVISHFAGLPVETTCLGVPAGAGVGYCLVRRFGARPD